MAKNYPLFFPYHASLANFSMLHHPALPKHGCENQAGGYCHIDVNCGTGLEPANDRTGLYNDLLVGGYTYMNNATNPGMGTNTDHGKTHFGTLTLNGNILMYTENDTALMELQTWTNFGDPSLQVRTDTPKDITLSDTTVSAGSYTTNVKVGGMAFKNALVSIWDGINQPFSGLTDSSAMLPSPIH